MIYLAAPYTHPSSLVRAARSRAAATAMYELAKSDILAFAPTFYGHELETRLKINLPYEFWLAWSRVMMTKCSEIGRAHV